jgi:hypothetical protein
LPTHNNPEDVKCKHCWFTDDECNFPDLFY